SPPDGRRSGPSARAPPSSWSAPRLDSPRQTRNCMIRSPAEAGRRGRLKWRKKQKRGGAEARGKPPGPPSARRGAEARAVVRASAGFRAEAAAFDVGGSVWSARRGSEVVGGRASRPQRRGDGRGDRRRGGRAGDRGSLRRGSRRDSRQTSASGRGRIRVVR